MISLSDELGKFPPVDLKSLEEIDSSMPDEIKNSIVLYNKAIGNVRAHNEDIAIIELKKAVSLNPNFHEAMNLLGLCYQYSKEYEKASELFKKVVAAESNSVQALEYIKAIDSGSTEALKPSLKTISKPSSRLERQQKQIPKIPEKKESRPSDKNKTAVKQLYQKNYTKYLIGFIAGMIVLFLIQLPFKNDKLEVPDLVDTNTPTPTLSSQNEFEVKYNSLNEEYRKLQKDLEKANSELVYYTSTSRLVEAEQLASEKKYEEAADLLVLLRNIEFKGSEKEKLDGLANNIMPRATWAVYLQGDNLFNSQNYKDAITKYSKVQTYGGNWEYMPIAFYNLGRSYVALNDKVKALESYKKLKELYPNSEYAKYADSRIAEIGG